jgi:hypothetical protein
MKVENCSNCERVIGKLEPAHVFHGNVVCQDCYQRLTDTESKQIQAAVKKPIKAKAKTVPPQTKAKGEQQLEIDRRLVSNRIAELKGKSAKGAKFLDGGWVCLILAILIGIINYTATGRMRGIDINIIPLWIVVILSIVGICAIPLWLGATLLSIVALWRGRILGGIILLIACFLVLSIVVALVITGGPLSVPTSSNLLQTTIDKANKGGPSAEAQIVNRRFSAMFGDMADDAGKFADTFSKVTGRDETDVKRWMAGFAQFYLATGMSRERVTMMSKSLTEMAEKLARSRGFDVEGVMEAFRGAIAGDTMGLIQYGIVISDNDVRGEGLAAGLDKNISNWTDAEKAQVRFNVILRETIQVELNTEEKTERDTGASGLK